MFPSLSESQITENNNDNDSSFLGNSDKKLIERLITINIPKQKQTEKIRTHWKKLPSDFMK